jgi:hypothetical protein
MAGGGYDVREGMEVVGTDQQPVGRVRSVGPANFLVERPALSSIFLSFEDIQCIADSRVVLNIPAVEVNTMNWPTPDETGSVEEATIRSQVHEGTEVVGEDQRPVGRVQAMLPSDFLLVQRAGQPDLYVPFDFIRDVTGGRVVLTIPADLAAKMDWAAPPLTGDERIGYEGS